MKIGRRFIRLALHAMLTAVNRPNCRITIPKAMPQLPSKPRRQPRNRQLLRWARRLLQLTCLGGFFWLFRMTSAAPGEELSRPTNLFFQMDPYAGAAAMLAAKSIIASFWPATLVLIGTYVFGRFFCGWICPLGTLLDLTDRLLRPLFRLTRRWMPDATSRLKPVRHVLLIASLLSAVLGLQLAGFLDPFSILTRGLIRHIAITSLILLLLIFSLEFLARRFWCRYLCPLGAMLGLIAPFSLLKRRPTRACGKCSSPAGNCTETCRMGAFGPSGQFTPESCNLCMDCQADCPTTVARFTFGKRKPAARPNTLGINPDKAATQASITQSRAIPHSAATDQQTLPSEPAAKLARQSIDESTLQSPDTSPSRSNVASPSQPTDASASSPSTAGESRTSVLRVATTTSTASAGVQGRPFEFSRRTLLVSMVAGAVLPTVARVTGTHAINSPARDLIRPPGASGIESDFLDACIRCGQCLKVCPTEALQPAEARFGLAGLFSPHVVPRTGHCEYDCTLCGQVCPTGAIPRLTHDVKISTVLGKAMFDTTRCLTWAGHKECGRCEAYCPIPDKAIHFKEQAFTDADGQETSVQLPYIVMDLCIGCGQCENICPVDGPAAIRVYRKEYTLAHANPLAVGQIPIFETDDGGQ